MKKQHYRQIIVLAVFLWLYIDGYSQARDCFKKDPFDDFKLGWNSSKIQGKVKSTQEFNYEQFVPDSMLFSYVTKEDMYFDSLGRLTRQVVFLERGRFHTDYRYTYNDKGHYTEFVNHDSMGNPVWKYKYDFVYKKRPSITKTVTYTSSDYKSSERSVYDSMGNLILGEVLLPSARIFLRDTYTYDKKGRRKKCTQYDATGTRITGYYEYVYDDTERKVEKKFIGADGKYVYSDVDQYNEECRRTYSGSGYVHAVTYYDMYGNVTQHEFVSYGLRKEKSSYKIEYYYDRHSNWIKKKVSSMEGILISTVERKIEYYEE